jgi:16S rRNA (cytosine967-C5)-methyltransferase
MPHPDRSPARSARELALRVLRDVDQKESYANLALDAQLGKSQLEVRDRAFATELVYGVARRQGTLDWLIEQVAGRPVSKIDDWALANLRSALYQISYMDRVPESAAVNEAVELAKRYGHAGVAKFVNGVLRNFLRRRETLPWPSAEQDQIGHLALTLSFPRWIVATWLEQYGLEDATALMEFANHVPTLTIRANRLKTDRGALITRLASEGITATPTTHSPDGLILDGIGNAAGLENLKSFRAGYFSVQDESSMLVAPVLNPQPGWNVVDVAAAPGGKSTHLAERMKNKGRVIACDLHAHKITLIEANAERLGTEIVQGLAADARHLDRLMPNRADAVLVDAPCSGLGTLARRPDARWRKQPADVIALAELQAAILDSVAVVLKPGGVLVYSTCTIHPAENQELVSRFVATHPEFEFDPIAPYLPESLRATAGEAGWVQLLPHLHGTDGFFIARMRKKLEGGPAHE